MKKLFLTLFAITAALTGFAQVNLAVGHPSIASSGNAGDGNDGNTGTRWESASSDPQAWQVDLGSAQTFNTIRILWEGAYSSTFEIIAGDEVGDDGYVVNGTTIYAVENQSLAGFPYSQVIELPNAVEARYVMFKGTARGTIYGHSFWEFGVYNLTNPLSLQSLSLSAAATQTIVGTPIALTLVGKNELDGIMELNDVTYEISNPSVGSVVDGQFVPTAAGETTIKAIVGNVQSNEVSISVAAGAKIDLFNGWQTRIYNLGLATNNSKVGAFDDNDGSNWDMLGKETGADEASRTYDVGFIADLRGIYDITSISIHFEGACSEAFTLSFAGEDGVFGDAVYSGGAMGINNHTENFSGQEVKNARYVKFLSTKAATQWSVKIFDFSVFGIGTASTDDVAPVITAAVAGETAEESITLNLTATDNSSKYIAYEVSYGNNTAIYALGSSVAGAPCPVVVDGLNGGTEYTFNIVAIDAFGNRSEPATVTASTIGDTFVLTAAPVPTKDAENVKAIYSDAYTPVTGFNIGWWGQATAVDYEAVEGDNIMKLSNFNYVGLEYNPDVDLSDMEYIHIDVLPMQAMNLGITPIMRGGLTEKSTDVGTLNVKEWNSIDLPLADFGFDLENFATFQLKLDRGTASEVLYVDNIYFWKGDGGTPQPTGMTDEGADENGVHTLTGTWSPESFAAIDAEAKANAYDFTAVNGMPQTYNNQNMAANPNTLFITKTPGTFLFNEVVAKADGDGYQGYNIQIIDHFANSADHSVNTSIAPITVVSPFFQRVTSMGNVYTTTVLPFNKTLPSNVQFYEVIAIDNTGETVEVELNQVTEVVAGVPYVAHLDGADITLAGGGETTIDWSVTPSAVGDDASFIPTFTNVAALRDDAAGKNYGINDVATEVNFTEVTEVPAMRAYIKTNGTSTGINDINSANKEIYFNIYTIDGKVVRQNVKSAEGLDSGIYIVNGKKMIVK